MIRTTTPVTEPAGSPIAATAVAAGTAVAPAADRASRIDAIVTELQGTIREMRCGSTERLVRQHVSMTQVHVLWLLEHHGAMPMSRLAEELDVSLSNATGLIDRMEEHGLVERARVPDDRRLVLVRPAAGGRLALEQNEGLRREEMRLILGRLDDGQLDRALIAFRDIRTVLTAEPRHEGLHHHHFIDSAD